MFPATLTRDHGNVRRILIVALATLMLFATLAVAPSHTPAASANGVEWRVDYWFTFAPENQTMGAGSVTIEGTESDKELTGVQVYGSTLGSIHTSCSDRFNIYTEQDVRIPNGSLGDEWGYSASGFSPVYVKDMLFEPTDPNNKAYSEPRIWDFGISIYKNGQLFKECGDPTQPPGFGNIVVTKATIPNPDPTGASFGFTTNYGDLGFSLANGQSDDSGQLLPASDFGSNYSVSESGMPNRWNLTSSACAGADGRQVDPASIDLKAGETVTCTFTNTYTPPDPTYLTLIKYVDGGPDDVPAASTEWTLTADGPETISGAGGVAKTEVLPGTYDLSETTGPAGYAPDPAGWVCTTDDVTPATVQTAAVEFIDTVTLNEGDSKTCTITNIYTEPDKASLTIVKTAINGDDTFAFLSAELGDFPIATSSGTGSEPFTNLDAGTYHVAEDVTALGADWDFMTLTCEGAIVSSTEGAAATVELAPGDNATCTFTNIYDPEDEPGLAQLKLVKEVDGGSAVPNDWTLFAATDEEGVTDLDDFDNLGGAGVFEDVYPNVGYTLSESAGPANYIASNWNCEAEYLDDVQTSGDLDPFTLEGDVVTLDPYARVVCTITNTYNPPPPPRLANLTIMKESFGGDDTFDFLGGSLGDFSITTVAETGSKIFTGLSAGTYVVAEDLDALFDLEDEWFFLDLVCDADQQTIDLDNAEATVYLAAGDSVTCTFTNELEGDEPPVPGIDIEKATNGYDADLPTDPDVPIIVAGDTVTWTYDVTNTGGVDLYDVDVTDNKEGDICTIDELLVGETKQCTKTGTASAADYGNVATATDGDVTDTDPSNYKGLAFLGTAQLGDTVWLDANNNGIQDNGEVGYNGAKVILTDADGNVVATLVTATGAWVGFYKFLELDAGTYTATLDLTTIGDYGVTTAKSFTIVLAEGDDYLKADFGLYKAEELPKTGTDSEALALFALGLLMMGGLAVLSTRKRRIEER